MRPKPIAHGRLAQGHPIRGDLRQEGARRGGEGLRDIDQPYRVTRAVAFAYVNEISLPETLKAQPTDTDRLTAIQNMQDAIDTRAQTEAWAQKQVQGEFCTKAPNCIRELNEWIAANRALADARTERAKNFGPTAEKFVAFKNVVRQVHGPTSNQYHRIHVRDNDPVEDKPATGTSPG
ncbi:MAG: hypothetical protein HYZ28_17670 [Myxococcales bacterium]|nr:hypothetical protein [Myxococcales bacterium]